MDLRKIRVTIQGADGSFHAICARKCLSDSIELVHCSTFSECCEKLAGNHTDYAVMAAGNTIAGNILPNYELVIQHNLHILAESYLPIALHLVGLGGARLEEIRSIRSHPMAILQCRSFTDTLTNVTITEGMDTATCAKELAQSGLFDSAVIAGSEVSERYGLKILKENIHSVSENFTRFWVLAKGESLVREINKASLSFDLRNEPGLLSDVLVHLKMNGFNLSSIHSHLLPEGRNTFRFFIDLEFDSVTNYRRLLKKLSSSCLRLQIMGEYAKQDLPT